MSPVREARKETSMTQRAKALESAESRARNVGRCSPAGTGKHEDHGPEDRGPAQDPLETYLRDISETPLLRREEERALADRIQRGDGEAREHLIRGSRTWAGPRAQSVLMSVERTCWHYRLPADTMR
jgi:DNA-directed RNA polymerase sigma subunit (sigma70/sigma32)